MITWKIEEKQADFILQVLQQRPFGEVHLLITELLRQAQNPVVEMKVVPPDSAGG